MSLRMYQPHFLALSDHELEFGVRWMNCEGSNFLGFFGMLSFASIQSTEQQIESKISQKNYIKKEDKEMARLEIEPRFTESIRSTSIRRPGTTPRGLS